LQDGAGGCVEQHFDALDRGLEVFGQAPVAVDPGKEALDHPSSGNDSNADLVVGLVGAEDF
jgi:hypothetical protein